MDYKSAWIAGLYEGEGSTGIAGKSARIQIGQVDRSVLDRVVEFTDMGKVGGPYRNGQHQPVYTWQIGNRYDIVRFFEMVWPLLSDRRKEQARPVIALATERIENETRNRPRNCGRKSRAGAVAHRRNGELPCRECADAENAYVAEQKSHHSRSRSRTKIYTFPKEV